MRKFAFLSLALVVSTASAQCPLPTVGAADPTQPFDGWTSEYAIGFPFTIGGTSYTGFYVTDHGIISFTNAGVPAAPGGGAQLYDPWASGPSGVTFSGPGLPGFTSDIIMAYWGDHSASYGAPNGGGIHVDNTSGTHCTISWIDSEPYTGSPPDAFSVQVSLYPDNSIVFRFDDRCDNTSSTYDPVTTVIGVQTIPDTVPVAGLDLSTTPVSPTDSFYEEFIGPGPVGSNTPDPNFDLGGFTLECIPTSPGYVIIPGTLPCAKSADIGTGCNGLSLSTTSEMAIGGNYEVQLSGVNAVTESFALPNFLLYGNPIAGGAPVGVLLPDLFGPACTAYMGGELGAFDIGPATAGVVTAGFMLPADISLVGIEVHAQGLSWDNPTGTPLFSLSNMSTTTVGF